MIEGLDALPEPIRHHILHSMHSNISIRHVYHVTELIYCLAKCYHNRVHGSTEPRLEQAWPIYRGNIFDDAWTQLFPLNQVPMLLEDRGVYIVGKADFIHEGVVYDLKTTASLYYILREAAPKPEHVEQVQTYHELLRRQGHRVDGCRLIYLDFGNHPLIFEVEPDSETLHRILIRAHRLDRALSEGASQGIQNPADWECGYCEHSSHCKEAQKC